MIQKIEHGSILELNLRRPPANALSPDLVEELAAAVAAAPRGGAEALVLSGAPGMFSAGLDVPLLLGLERDDIEAMWRTLYGLLHQLAASPVPVAAAITGHSPAGGAVMALFCDHRVMAQAAEKPFKIGLNEVQVGLPLPPVIYRALEWLLGPRQAGRLATAGLLVSGEEAHAIGLVDELAPVEEVVERALAWCRELLARPRQAMLATRRLARSGLVAQFAGDEEITAVTDSWFSEETQAALAALVEGLKKRS